MKTLIVVPACNEAASLDQFLPKLRIQAGESTILVVDDGSHDKTSAIAEKHECSVITHSVNRGLGCSLRSGYGFALKWRFDAVVTMDSDGQHDPRFLPQMVRLLSEADIVIGSRYHPDSERINVPFDRDLLNISVTAQMRIVTGWIISDPLSGFWGIKGSFIKFLFENGRLERYGSCLEHLIKLWYLGKERPKLIEFAHPAIYGNGGDISLLTRDYSPSNREARVERFGTHALHVIEAVADVRAKLGEARVDAEIETRRTTRHL